MFNRLLELVTASPISMAMTAVVVLSVGYIATDVAVNETGNTPGPVAPGTVTTFDHRSSSHGATPTGSASTNSRTGSGLSSTSAQRSQSQNARTTSGSSASTSTADKKSSLQSKLTGSDSRSTSSTDTRFSDSNVTNSSDGLQFGQSSQTTTVIDETEPNPDVAAAPLSIQELIEAVTEQEGQTYPDKLEAEVKIDLDEVQTITCLPAVEGGPPCMCSFSQSGIGRPVNEQWNFCN